MAQPTYTGPARPIGYVETQRKWTGDPAWVTSGPDATIGEQHLNDALRELLSQNTDYIPYGSRMEMAVDGNGVPHYTLYVGAVPNPAGKPPVAEPLDPHNLNGAPVTSAGATDPSVDTGLAPGWREQQFGRGTD